MIQDSGGGAKTPKGAPFETFSHRLSKMKKKSWTEIGLLAPGLLGYPYAIKNLRLSDVAINWGGCPSPCPPDSPMQLKLTAF